MNILIYIGVTIMTMIIWVISFWTGVYWERKRWVIETKKDK